MEIKIKGNKELTDFLGERCLSVDVNSMKPLDNLCHPVSIIKDAEELADLLKNFVCHVNIIPVNKIKERNYRSDRKSANRFRQYLEDLGINATVRRTLGADIDAACGQLRREYEI